MKYYCNGCKSYFIWDEGHKCSTHDIPPPDHRRVDTANADFFKKYDEAFKYNTPIKDIPGFEDDMKEPQ